MKRIPAILLAALVAACGATAPFEMPVPIGNSQAFDCPVTERAAYEEAIWLPHQLFLGEEGDVNDVASAFRKVLAHADALSS